MTTRAPKPESWRSMTKDDQRSFDEWIANAFADRWEIGRERYHADNVVFQGDPLEHLIEEALDLLVYAWVLKRKEQR